MHLSPVSHPALTLTAPLCAPTHHPRFSSVLYCVTEYFADVTLLTGPSMLPTVNLSGDIVIADLLAVKRRNYSRGDVVIAHSMTNETQTVCKRIRAIEGDTVYPPRSTLTRMHFPEKIVVPRGHVWLEGDNSMNSTDSRYYGPVPEGMLIGVAHLKLWPLYPLFSVTPADEAKAIEKDIQRHGEDSSIAQAHRARETRRARVVYRDGGMGVGVEEQRRERRRKERGGWLVVGHTK